MNLGFARALGQNGLSVGLGHAFCFLEYCLCQLVADLEVREVEFEFLRGQTENEVDQLAKIGEKKEHPYTLPNASLQAVPMFSDANHAHHVNGSRMHPPIHPGRSGAKQR